jgi:hypothetical protein
MRQGVYSEISLWYISTVRVEKHFFVSDVETMKCLELCGKYWIPYRKTQMKKIKISWFLTLCGPLLWYLVLGISLFIKRKHNTPEK